MSSKSFLGVILILLGVGFLLQQMDMFSFGAFFSTWWPLILIALGVIQLLSKPPAYTAGIIFLGLGGYFQLRQLGIVETSFFRFFFPIIVILVGVRILLGSNRGAAGFSDQTISHFNIFSGYETGVTSQTFRGGSVTSIFGASEIDLRQAALESERVVMDITVIFGGSTIKVPEHWRVTADGIPIFGGWENKTKHVPKEGLTAPTIHFRCVALFGGIEIHN
jgi:predicted membrane protein